MNKINRRGLKEQVHRGDHSWDIARVLANIKRSHLFERKSALLNVFIMEMNPGANVELAHCNLYDSNDVMNSAGKMSSGPAKKKGNFNSLPMS